MQVSLLNQEVIIDKIQSVVESKLRNSNEVRTFQEQVCPEELCQIGNRKGGLILIYAGHVFIIFFFFASFLHVVADSRTISIS